jgi:MFS family permease
MSSNQYTLASASFYIGAFLFSTVGGLMLKVVSPSTWLSACAVTWGIMATLQASVSSPAGISGIRFLLGACEASFAPGCAIYLSFWYLKSELCLRIAAYAGTSALSGVISGLIAYGISRSSHLALPAWRVVFLVEGLPTILIGLLTPLVLPGRPESMTKSTWFLTDEDREILNNRRTRFTRNKDDGIDLIQVKK